MRKALYRKYRPCRLADVVGQEQITEPLSAALKSGQFSHAYLFTGPRGCGKTSVARIFAHEVNHFKYELEDEYLDIIEIDAASNTGVDNIRDLREKATIVPSEGQYKIYIIDEVHMLSKSAFNALLKTLEEPPAHVIFIMATTDPEKVPVTILSRAQVFQFRLAPPEVMLAHLQKIAEAEKIPIDEDALAIIAERGGGSFRDSLSLLDQISTLSDQKIDAAAVTAALGLPENHVTTDLLTAYKTADLPAASALLKSYYSTGGKAEILAERLIEAIIDSPEAIFYQLLSQLTSVRDPFAEAKLLLCFMPKNLPTPVNMAATPVSTLVTATPAASIPVKTEQSAQLSSENPTPTPVNHPAAPNTAPDNSLNPTPHFTWEDFLERVDTDSARLRILLRQCSHSLDNNILTITPNTHQAKKALARPADRNILHKNLPDGLKLIITEDGAAAATSTQKPSAKDPTLSQISDIMGNIQEVQTDGGNPF